MSVHEFGEDGALYDAAGGLVHVLNDSAFFIWQKCDGMTTVEDLLEQMLQRYGQVPRERLELDIQVTLEKLYSLGVCMRGLE
ncbi:MAG: PqqD family protein [Candidatus Vogelbacteria bacterium]|nr:PqqD family protein [Candidatus Vogelbacteria bacterium]